jgi:hypothetical protein
MDLFGDMGTAEMELEIIRQILEYGCTGYTDAISVVMSPMHALSIEDSNNIATISQFI